MAESLKRIEVRWIDSCGPEDHWRFKDDVMKLRPTKMLTRGFLLVRDEDFITVASSIGGSGEFGGVVVIPRVAVTSVSPRDILEEAR